MTARMLRVDPAPEACISVTRMQVGGQERHVPLRDLRLLDDWRDQLCRDRGLSKAAVCIGVRISHHVSRADGYAYPSTATLADGICARSTLQDAIRSLCERGHMSVAITRGRGRANRYFPIVHGSSAR